MTPEEIAEALLNMQQVIWRAEWARADLAAMLEEATDEGHFRDLCIGELDTSWRNVHKWASKARQVPPEARSPEYAYRTHPLLKPAP